MAMHTSHMVNSSNHACSERNLWRMATKFPPVYELSHIWGLVNYVINAGNHEVHHEATIVKRISLTPLHVL